MHIYIFINYASSRQSLYLFCWFLLSSKWVEIDSNRNWMIRILDFRFESVSNRNMESTHLSRFRFDSFQDVVIHYRLEIISEFTQLSFQHRMKAFVTRRHRDIKMQHLISIIFDEATTITHDVNVIQIINAVEEIDCSDSQTYLTNLDTSSQKKHTLSFFIQKRTCFRFLWWWNAFYN